jgi:HEAT repeat protein
MGRLVLAILACGAWTWAIVSGASAPAAEDFAQGLKSPDETARIRAIDTLERQGAKTAGAMAALTEALRDPSAKVRVRAADALAQIGAAGEEAGSALGDLLNDPSMHVRRAAVRALAKVRPDPATSVPVLIKALDDADPAVRVGVLDALAESGKQAVPALSAALRNEKTARWACLALSELGADAGPAAADLQRLLREDRRPEVRREAALALGAIGPSAAPAVPVLLHAMSETDYGVRMAAVFALGRIGPEAKAAEPALRKLQGTSAPPLLRILAISTLARIRPDDKTLAQKAVVALADALRSKDASVRAAGVRALAELRSDPEFLASAMSRIIEEGPAESRNDALAVLMGLGEPAVPALVKALRFRELQPIVAAVLGRIGTPAKAAVPALIDVAAKGGSPVARRQALLALASMGPAARAVVPAATQALRDPDALVRYSACYALGKMGVTALEARPALEQELENKDPHLALAAAWALARIDPDCTHTPPRALPLLVKGLADADPMVRLEAAGAVRCLGPMARPAADALRKTAKEDPSELVRDMAEQALKAMEE